MDSVPVRRSDPAAVLALLQQHPRGWAEIARRLRRGEDATGIATSLEIATATLFDQEDSWTAAVDSMVEAIEAWSREGIHVLTADDPRFPARLDVVRTLPPVLWMKGTTNPKDAQGVAIVGSRRASSQAKSAAGEMASALAQAERSVISGLAAGVDTAALSAAVSTHGRFVAVIGTGIRRSYPAENIELQERIARGGQLISQFWPDAPPTKFSFPMRNEVMSGWAAATLVMQADARSGARMQARVAVEQGRRVFLYEPIMAREGWARSYVDSGKALFVSTPDEVLGALDART